MDMLDFIAIVSLILTCINLGYMIGKDRNEK